MFGGSDFTTELEEISYSISYITELEHKIKTLEQQNHSLKACKAQADHLTQELKHATALKETYEEKFNEASLKLLHFDDESLPPAESEQLALLNSKITLLISSNDELRSQILQQKSIILKLQHERDTYRDQLISLERLINRNPNAILINKESLTEEDQIDSPSRPESNRLVTKAQGERFFRKKEVVEDFRAKVEYFDPKIEFFEAKAEIITSPTPGLATQPAATLSLSPIARTHTTRNLKPAGSRQSPKLRHTKKSKSSYMPSFLRKPTKPLKVECKLP